MGPQEIGVHPMRFLKLKEVMEKTALSRSAIYRKMNDGEFPESVSLGERAIAWVESEVDEWMEARLQTRVVAM
ncbi:TPA: AlpA family phage regulatory protein [Vibrio vulnificus]|nr:AlpA family transcriptional regulator [Vibrio vulnificus]POC36106.1 DNA-binding protein [Vibrio vulnificus]POC58031.1 DNA-binding protein [Vibrio vulnificus]POC73346.1 DNA-binding protein [Vibrio vulnificus]RZQ70889.1 AlpA family transcriptional regulator [Vibrio vulnificus]